MERRPILLNREDIPEQFHAFMENATVYDSSCSDQARVYYFDNGPGYFLKVSSKGSLSTEALMSSFFHKKSMAPEVLAYESLEKDWLLTRRVPGEDCIWHGYLENPLRLCDTLAELLRSLHETDTDGCPVTNRTADYLAAAKDNYQRKRYDAATFSDQLGFSSYEDAWQEVKKNRPYLRADTLIHGDYCLPNIILDNWQFSSYIDVGFSGIGDRHVDLYWGAWSLHYNLKSDRYSQRFLDAYGRESIEPDLLRTVAAIELLG